MQSLIRDIWLASGNNGDTFAIHLSSTTDGMDSKLELQWSCLGAQGQNRQSAEKQGQGLQWAEENRGYFRSNNTHVT